MCAQNSHHDAHKQDSDPIQYDPNILSKCKFCCSIDKRIKRMKKKEQQQHQQLYCTANCIITYFVDERDVKREAAWPANKNQHNAAE